MKFKKNNQIYTLTESQLHNIVINEINNLVEYARPRNEIIERISSYFPQIIENWCLVHYCTLSNTDVNWCKEHWKKELQAHIVKCSSFKLKGKNDYKSRFSMVKQAENKDELLSDIKQIDFIVGYKFNIENIKINDNDIYQQVLNDLINNKENIFDVISSMNVEKIIDYINKI